MFSKLEQSQTMFVLVGSAEVDATTECCTGGVNGASFDNWDPRSPYAPVVLNQVAGNPRVVGFVDADASSRHGRHAGIVSLHEAIHMSGVVDRNRMYRDRETCQPFQAEATAAGTLGVTPEPWVGQCRF